MRQIDDVTMPSQHDLWALVAARGQGILATIRKDGSPQLSNVLYVPDAADRVLRISTTADRLKARNLSRDPRGAIHVSGHDFWHYAVADCEVTMSATASASGDDAVEELQAVHSAFRGGQDREAFAAEMIRNRRLVLRLHVSRLYGVMVEGVRRPAADP
jgi:PPOX class probable F420-dependent enzyme